MYKYLVSFGGNLKSEFGSPIESLKHAIGKLELMGLSVQKKSRWYSSISFPDTSSPNYINGCLKIICKYDPYDTIKRLKVIEKEMGRVINQRWGSRVCDFDILACKNFILPSFEIYSYWKNLSLNKQVKQRPSVLILPHPRIQDRAFVLIPLLDIEPKWVHPVLGIDLTTMINNLSNEQRSSISLVSD